MRLSESTRPIATAIQNSKEPNYCHTCHYSKFSITIAIGSSARNGFKGFCYPGACVAGHRASHYIAVYVQRCHHPRAQHAAAQACACASELLLDLVNFLHALRLNNFERLVSQLRTRIRRETMYCLRDNTASWGSGAS
jgi:hypothetical protein